MPASIACARSRRDHRRVGRRAAGVFGEYRAPTGVGAAVADRRAAPTASPRCARSSRATERELGRKLRILVGKPGLDGHSNGAEQIALLAARDAGFEVIYEGIRSTPEQIAPCGSTKT